jgi:hypothetical protein
MTDENAKKLLQLLNGYLNDHHDGESKRDDGRRSCR